MINFILYGETWAKYVILLTYHLYKNNFYIEGRNTVIFVKTCTQWKIQCVELDYVKKKKIYTDNLPYRKILPLNLDKKKFHLCSNCATMWKKIMSKAIV